MTFLEYAAYGLCGLGVVGAVLVIAFLICAFALSGRDADAERGMGR